MAELTNLLVTGDAKICGKIYDDKPSLGYGYCSTDPDLEGKVITVDTPWELKVGSIIILESKYTNTAEDPTFSVNDTEWKSVWYNEGVISKEYLQMAGNSTYQSIYIYNGTYYVWIGWNTDGALLETLAKVASSGSYADLKSCPRGTLYLQKNGSNVGNAYYNYANVNRTWDFTTPTATDSGGWDDVNSPPYLSVSNRITQSVTNGNIITTNSGSASSISYGYIDVVGKMALLSMQIYISSGTNVGGNVYKGTIIDNTYIPKYGATGFGYSNESLLFGYIDSSGNITVRVLFKNAGSGDYPKITWSYMIK